MCVEPLTFAVERQQIDFGIVLSSAVFSVNYNRSLMLILAPSQPLNSCRSLALNMTSESDGYLVDY